MKRTFEFEPWESGLCDVYVRGVKVISGHNATRGQVALNVPDDFEPKKELAIEPHDPRKPLERKEDENGMLILPEKMRTRVKRSKLPDESLGRDEPPAL